MLVHVPAFQHTAIWPAAVPPPRPAPQPAKAPQPLTNDDAYDFTSVKARLQRKLLSKRLAEVDACLMSAVVPGSKGQGAEASTVSASPQTASSSA